MISEQSKKRYFNLKHVRKIVENKKPGLIAVNLVNGFENAVVIFEHESVFYKTEGSINFFKEADPNLQVECEEVTIQITDCLYERKKENE
jgi:hypothetical protein